MTTPWTTFPYLGEFSWDAPQLIDAWPRLHRGDMEPLPQDPALLQAWRLFHEGRFHDAYAAGLQLGERGITVVNKATAIYANYLEPSEPQRLALFREVADRAETQLATQPTQVGAWYWRAYALGRYSQGISVSKALAQGLGSRIKESLERVIALEPAHADAHLALGTFHAEVIDKVGPMVGAMTYGAKKDVGLRLFEQGLKLHPGSVIGMVEHAKALLMLGGPAQLEAATRLYEQAAHARPLDATERLDIEMAQIELAN